MGLSLAQVARYAEASIVCGGQQPEPVISGRAGNRPIEELLTDSRYLRRADVCLFVALRTNKNDGHRYIAELYEKGVRAFLVSAVPETAAVRMPDAVFLQVSDTLAALQRLAAAYRRDFDIPVVGITGSNGKTVVKEWLAGLLAPDKRVVKSPRSYNSQIGVPLSLWELQPWHEIGIFEAGISQPDEMAALADMIRPTIGIFTNIGAAHAANFADNARKAAEKLRLFHGAEKLIYNADDEWISAAIAADEAMRGVRRLAWSARLDGDRPAGRPMAPVVLQLKAKSEVERAGRRFTCLRADYTPAAPAGLSGAAASASASTAVVSSDAAPVSEQWIEVPFSDAASLENVMHCWLFLLDAGVAPADIAARMARLAPVEMRMELKEGINRNYLINDAYNSDYDAFGLAVDYLLHQAGERRKRIVLSDILQSGLPDERLYTAVADLLRRHRIDALVGIGPQLMRYRDLFSGMETAFYPDTEAFMRVFDPSAWHDEVILLKGARSFAFERIARRLQKKSTRRSWKSTWMP